MTGYEFTRTDFTKQVTPRAFEASIVAFQIEYAYKTGDIREEAEYIDAKEWFIDSTMSCDQQEATTWMKYYMANSIAYGIKTKYRDWQHKFLAAFDLYNALAQC